MKEIRPGIFLLTPEEGALAVPSGAASSYMPPGSTPQALLDAEAKAMRESGFHEVSNGR